VCFPFPFHHKGEAKAKEICQSGERKKKKSSAGFTPERGEMKKGKPRGKKGEKKEKKRAIYFHLQ